MNYALLKILFIIIYYFYLLSLFIIYKSMSEVYMFYTKSRVCASLQLFIDVVLEWLQ